jgi:hypothetical protein
MNMEHWRKRIDNCPESTKEMFHRNGSSKLAVKASAKCDKLVTVITSDAVRMTSRCSCSPVSILRISCLKERLQASLEKLTPLLGLIRPRNWSSPSYTSTSEIHFQAVTDNVRKTNRWTVRLKNKIVVVCWAAEEHNCPICLEMNCMHWYPHKRKTDRWPFHLSARTTRSL